MKELDNWKEYCLSKKADLKKMFPKENIENPQTLSAKLQWLKIYDSIPLKAYCADKVTVRNYCTKKLGIDLCLPLLKVYDSPNQIEWDILPNQFVIKCNHGSAMNMIVYDKSKVNKTKICQTLSTWLNIKYGDLSYELFYNLIEPKIIIEPYMKDKDNGALTDYKFICFNGEVKYMQVVNERNTGKPRFNYYDTDFKPMTNVSWNAHPADYSKLDKKPENFELMKQHASKLCEDFICVRVDFYEINGKIYLGELTFIPASGKLQYKDPKTNLIFGQMLKLPID